jgi:hypothetical protein
MDTPQLREDAEREELWGSLAPLRPEIDRLIAGEFDDAARQHQLVMLLARIVANEMDFRARRTAAN